MSKTKREIFEICGTVLICLGFLGLIALGVGSAMHMCAEEEIVDSEITEIISLPNASVEMIMVDGVLTEARVIESLGDVVGVRSYTNVQWDDSRSLDMLTILKQKINKRFGVIVFETYDKYVAVFS